MKGPHQPVPTEMQELAVRLECAARRLMVSTTGRKAGVALGDDDEQGREDDAWEEGAFRPEACLVNYYGEGDTLNGHRDDVEPDQNLPIISIRYRSNPKDHVLPPISSSPFTTSSSSPQQTSSSSSRLSSSLPVSPSSSPSSATAEPAILFSSFSSS